jgi:hypothetical protein
MLRYIVSRLLTVIPTLFVDRENRQSKYANHNRGVGAFKLPSRVVLHELASIHTAGFVTRQREVLSAPSVPVSS